jgi:methionine sulfoxide reductase heme-binding subunit
MNDQLLWYTTRAAGAVSLLLLSGVVMLGIASRMRVEGRGWPRFLTATLHRDLSLLALVFLTLHVVTAVTDPFTHLGIAALLPFASYYRTFWLGLGAVAVELMIAVVVTSLLRRHIGARVWRGLHWLAYVAWPIGLLHGIGTGTDSSSLWMLAVDAVCIAGVGGMACWRLLYAPSDPLAQERRAAMRRASDGTV